MENENVILFPKWKKTLEEDSLLALKEKRYEEALHKLDQLLDYQVDNHEIVIGKLICLMELDRYEDAQLLSEKLLENKNENYYHYVHIYLTILFQTNQYKRLMEQVEYELDAATVPQAMKEQFQQLYNMSKKMNVEIRDEKNTEYINELLEAVKEQNHLKQWRTVENLRKINALPSIKVTEKLLTESLVHPVTKTAIFMWLQDSDYNENIRIHKLDMQVEVTPSGVSDIHSLGIYKQILLLINKIELKNPTLYQLMETLLYRYIYVRYPIIPSSEHVEQIAEALTGIGETYLDIHHLEDDTPDSEVLRYQEEIKLCETLYLSIIEE
ncbi:DUF3196 family protein [Virgibacillus necropolis]|uniref:DUF3196 family protein n=1 Tax=Virgibacillus necropolis TaxID=163877 RepID=UPI00384FAFCB